MKVHHGTGFPNIVRLAEIGLLMPLQTAAVERGFSVQNSIHSKQCNRLNPESVQIDDCQLSRSSHREIWLASSPFTLEGEKNNVFLWNKKFHMNICTIDLWLFGYGFLFFFSYFDCLVILHSFIWSWHRNNDVYLHPDYVERLRTAI